jgi:hypothetical protein
MVLQHERQGNFYPTDESKALLNAAKSKGFPSRARVCTYCGKDNHIVDNCFKKHDFPPHLRKNSTVNKAALEGGIEELPASSTAGPTITQEQALQLIALLQTSFPSQDFNNVASNHVGSIDFTSHTSVDQGKTSQPFHSCSLSSWILDFGAGYHMCNSLQWFLSYKATTPVKIKLPIGNIVLAKHTCIIRFSPTFIVTDVLYVPNFSVNLLSDGFQCSIHDPVTKMTIGSADVF